MARGWDSKAIEDQIADAEAAKALRAVPVLSPDQRVLLATIASLELSRANVRARLETSRDERYCAQLEAALEHLDAELRAARANLDPG